MGVLFSKLQPKSVFNSAERVERVELRHSQGEGDFAIGIDGNRYSMYTLIEPYVTLMYEVAVDDYEFVLHYDDSSLPLKLGESK